jgi:hypothetical protein
MVGTPSWMHRHTPFGVSLGLILLVSPVGFCVAASSQEAHGAHVNLSNGLANHTRGCSSRSFHHPSSTPETQPCEQTILYLCGFAVQRRGKQTSVRLLRATRRVRRRAHLSIRLRVPETRSCRFSVLVRLAIPVLSRSMAFPGSVASRTVAASWAARCRDRVDRSETASTNWEAG